MVIIYLIKKLVVFGPKGTAGQTGMPAIGRCYCICKRTIQYTFCIRTEESMQNKNISKTFQSHELVNWKNTMSLPKFTGSYKKVYLFLIFSVTTFPIVKWKISFVFLLCCKNRNLIILFWIRLCTIDFLSGCPSKKTIYWRYWRKKKEKSS